MMPQSSDSSDFEQNPNSPIPEAKIFHWSEINLQQSFKLIDSLIPAKTCLHFQIVPLCLHNNCLVLGLVNYNDVAVINYLRSLITKNSLTLQIRQLDSKNHQLIISAYFNHQRTKEKTNLVDNNISTPDNSNFEDYNYSSTEEDNLSSYTSYNYNDLDVTSSLSKYNSLEIGYGDISISDTSLKAIPAQKLWYELLNRLLKNDGIGRLYFECHPDHGRIIWTQDGNIRLSLDNLDYKIFQGVIDEVKRLGHIPIQPLKQLKKVELEQYYHQERILARIQLKPEKYGEEGTLQILRGKALTFYQQQQMNELGDQAVKLAKHLERKLRQVYARTQINPYPFKALATLKEIEANIKKQLDLLES